MSEGGMWKSIRPVLKPLDPVRIESPIVPGIPDVNYNLGWIELKYMPRWPVKGGPLRIDHYTKEQRDWAIQRKRAGGKVFLLLKVGRNEWLLFDGVVAALSIGKLNREQLYNAVIARWTRTPRTAEILPCLT